MAIGSWRKLSLLVAGFVWLAVGASAGAQNQLINPDFDSSIASWLEGSSGSTGSSAQDPAIGSPAPGSMQLVNTSPGAGASRARSQCVAVHAGQAYELGASVHMASGQGSTGEFYVGLFWYPAVDCSGASSNAATTFTVSATGSWQRAYTQKKIAPAGSLSARVVLTFRKVEAGGSVAANVDSVFFGPEINGDFGLDGHLDLVLRNTVTNQNRVWAMNGVERLSTTLVTPDALTAQDQLVATCDLNLDSKSDLVFWNASSGAVAFWIMNGTARDGAPLPLSGAGAPGGAWRVAAMADFNHDGSFDLLWRNLSTQKLMIWTLSLATYTGTIVPNPDQAVDANWSVVAARDLDADGETDLLWYNATSGKIVRWLMDADVQRLTGGFTNPSNAGNNNWQVLAGGDYGVGAGGLVGTNDLVWRNATSGKFVVWYMDSAGNRTAGVFTTPDGPAANPLDWTIAGPR